MSVYGIDHITVSSIPWVYIVEWTPDKRLAGRQGGFFDSVAASLNLSYTLSMPEDFQWGSCEADGSSCTGMLGDVLYNRTDVCVGPFSASPVYSRLFTSSSPVFHEEYTVVTGTPIAYAVNAFSTFTSIEGIVYFLFTLLPFGIAVLVALNSRNILPKIGQGDPESVPRLFLELMKLNAQNPSDIRVRTTSNRLLVAGSMIASLFTAIIVSSSIKASMMRRDPTERIKTIADLLKKKGQLKPFVAAKTFLTDILQEVKTGEMHELSNWLEDGGYVPVETLVSKENIRGLLNGTMFTFFNCEMTAIFIARSYYELSEKQRGYLICLEQILFGAPLVWYYHNSLPKAFINEFNRRTTWLFESPTRFVFDFKYSAVPKNRYAKSTSLSGDAVVEALRVEEVIGCFYVLASGTGGAVIGLLLELLMKVIVPTVNSIKSLMAYSGN